MDLQKFPSVSHGHQPKSRPFGFHKKHSSWLSVTTCGCSWSRSSTKLREHGLKKGYETIINYQLFLVFQILLRCLDPQNDSEGLSGSILDVLNTRRSSRKSTERSRTSQHLGVFSRRSSSKSRQMDVRVRVSNTQEKKRSRKQWLIPMSFDGWFERWFNPRNRRKWVRSPNCNWTNRTCSTYTYDSWGESYTSQYFV